MFGWGKKDPKPQRQVKWSSDGYLRPEYWRCIVCKDAAGVAVPSRVFQAAVQRGAFAGSDEADLTAASNAIDANFSRQEVAAAFDDTMGLARNRVGEGFDCVYLCEEHAEQQHRSFMQPATSVIQN
jgi:hypothetical protein